MDLKAYLSPLFRYWWLIVIAAVVAAGTSYVITGQQPPVYQARTTMIIGRAVYEANPNSNDLWMSQQLATFYADIGMRGEVQTATMEALGLTWLPEYYVRPIQNSQLMEVVVTDNSAVRAQAVANEIANQLIRRSPTASTQGQEHQGFVNEQINYLEEKIRETLTEIDDAEMALTEMNSARQIAEAQNEIEALQTKLAQLQTNYAALISNTEQGAINTLTVIERAGLPTQPIGPQRIVITLVAAVVAMVVASGAAYLLDYLDDTVKTPEDVANLLPVPVLANIPMIGKNSEQNTRGVAGMLQRVTGGFLRKPAAKSQATSNGKGHANNDGVYIFTSNNPRSPVSEEFRTLRINLEFAGVDKPLKTILVTSPSPAEGKTSVATNLAIVMAQAGKKVYLVDGDFRKPSINEHFNIANERGLSNIFLENQEVSSVALPWKENLLRILTTGIMPPNPVDLLSSQRMNSIIEEMKNDADVVIIDGPPLMFPDSLALATKVDGVLMVLRHSFTRKGVTQASHKQLSQVGGRIIGVVLNKTPGRRANYYSHYHYRRYYRKEDGGVKVEQKSLN